MVPPMVLSEFQIPIYLYTHVTGFIVSIHKAVYGYIGLKEVCSSLTEQINKSIIVAFTEY